MGKAYIVDAKRTPVGKARGCLSKTRADDLLVHAIQSVLIAADESQEINNNIDDIIVGCAMPEGPQGLNIARIATLLAGLPDSTPAYTLNRFLFFWFYNLLPMQQISLNRGLQSL